MHKITYKHPAQHPSVAANLTEVENYAYNARVSGKNHTYSCPDLRLFPSIKSRKEDQAKSLPVAMLKN